MIFVYLQVMTPDFLLQTIRIPLRWRGIRPTEQESATTRAFPETMRVPVNDTLAAWIFFINVANMLQQNSVDFVSMVNPSRGRRFSPAALALKCAQRLATTRIIPGASAGHDAVNVEK